MCRYSVVTYNFGRHERLHEIAEKSPHADYLYITDDPTAESETWRVVHVENKWPGDPFAACFDVRYNIFDYVTTDIVLRVDGSMSIEKNTDPIVEAFTEGGYDIAFPTHPVRRTVLEEYAAWVSLRGYPVEQARRCLAMLTQWFRFSPRSRGLAEYGVMVQRDNKANRQLNALTHVLLQMMAMEGKEVERVDQIVGSLVMQRFFPDLKVMFLSPSIHCHSFFDYKIHGTDDSMPPPQLMLTPYWLDKPVEFHPMFDGTLPSGIPLMTELPRIIPQTK